MEQKNIWTENLEEYSRKLNVLDVTFENSTDEIWCVVLDKETQSEYYVDRLIHTTKLKAVVEAEKSIEAMLDHEFQRECFKKEYGIKD